MAKLLKLVLIVLFIFFVNVLSITADNQTELDNIRHAIYALEETGFDYVDDYAGLDFTSGTAPDRVAGVHNFAQDFDRTALEYIYTDTSLSWETETYGVSFWITKTADVTTPIYLLGNRKDSPSLGGWNMMVQRSNHPSSANNLYTYAFTTGGGGIGGYTTTLTVADGLTHIVSCYNGTHLRTWKDSVEQTAYSAASNTITYPAGAITSFEVSGYDPGTGWTGYVSGVYDEIYYFTTCPSQDNVDWLYNSGSGNFATNGAFGEGFNIVLDYPINNTKYNDYNGSIQVNATEADSCNINNTNWIYSDYDNVTYRWDYNGTIPDGNYTIYVNCSKGGSTADLNFNFFIDTINPTITLYNPLNQSLQFQNFYVNVSYYDTNLYRTNTTIYAPNGTIVYNNYSGDLNQNSYNVTDLFNISNQPLGVYTLEMIASDKHTYGDLHGLSYIKELDGITFYKGQRSYKMYAGYWNNGQINFLTPQQRQNLDVQFNINKLNGEYKFDLNFLRPAQDYNFGFILPKVQGLTLINEDIGHFIWRNWYIDFEDWVHNGFDVNVRETANYYLVYTNTVHCNVEPGQRCSLDPAIGGLNIVATNSTFEIVQTDSVQHIDLTVPEFTITDTDWEVVFNNTFNLTRSSELIFFGSAQLDKVAGAASQSVDVDLRFIFNGVTYIEQTIRSIANSDSIGVVTLPITQIYANVTNNNLVLEMKISRKDMYVNVSGAQYHAFTNYSNTGEPITNIIGEINNDFTSTSYVELGNTTILRQLNSSVYADIHHTLSADENLVTVNCYADVNESSVIPSPVWTRTIISSGDTGSSGIAVLTQRYADNWTGRVWCKSDSGTATVTNNITFYTFAMEANANALIIGNAENITNITGLTGNNNEILTLNFTPLAGNETHLSFTIIAQSSSGAQVGTNSPEFIVNSTIPGLCEISYKRSLSSNSDIGTIKGYLDCSGVTPGQPYQYKIYTNVATGESLNILMAALTAIDTTGTDIITGNVPPVITISTPSNATTQSGVIDINWTLIDINGDTTQTNITLLNASDMSIVQVLATNYPDSITTLSFNTSLFINDDYIILAETIENVTSERYTDTDLVYITIYNAPTPPISDCILCLNSTNICNTTYNFNKRSVAYFQKEYLCNGGIDMIAVMIGLFTTVTFLTIIGLLLYNMKEKKRDKEMKTEILNKLNKLENEGR